MPPNVALFYDPLFLGHETLSHPESPRRVEACLELLETSGLAARLDRLPSRDATEEELARIHNPDYIRAMQRLDIKSPVMVTPDTVASPRTYAAAVRAAGACLSATEAVVRGEAAGAFCLTRPPGHHAIVAAPMGFCFFNSVAVAAAHARAALGLARVAFVDIDIHHGNGTQDAFYADGSVLYVSTHQYPFYPGTGWCEEAGEGAGAGATLNLSLPAGCGDAEYAHVYDEVIVPKLRRFRPELLLVSAGYDAHWADPIDGSKMRLSCAGYAALVARLREAASELCYGRLVLALEGGYDLTALPWSVRNSVEVLLGEPPAPDPVGAAPAVEAPDVSWLIEGLQELHGPSR
jgi:acetoin utilization deacetylase AcuC-like enzyme